MATPPQTDVTQLLVDWRNGDKAALDRLMPLVYSELRRLADHYLRNERPDHTLQATALVHEAYIKLIDQSHLNWQNRAHFFGVGAQVMRHILVDHARSRKASKRGGGQQHLPLDEALDFSRERAADLVVLDNALIALAAIDPRKAKVVELRFFGGLTLEETAEVLDMSLITIRRDLKMAEAWLHRELSRQ